MQRRRRRLPSVTSSRKSVQGFTEWSRDLFSKAKLQHHAALWVILHLDMAQDFMPLSHAEANLRTRLKRRLVSLEVLERARKKQCARITNLREGDANTKYFRRRINARLGKNHVHRIKYNQCWVTEHALEENILFTTSLASCLGVLPGRLISTRRVSAWSRRSFSLPETLSPRRYVTP
ncbi:retrotransposon protein [Hordeum vulgare]|nr:retrotransposon protein [Hordeum vulgare]